MALWGCAGSESTREAAWGAGEGGHTQAPDWGVSVWFTHSPHSDTPQVFIPSSVTAEERNPINCT